MRSYAIEDLEQSYGREKPTPKRRPFNAVHSRGNASSKGEDLSNSTTLLGDPIVHNPLEVLEAGCCVFQEIMADQRSMGVHFQIWFLIVTFLAQLRRHDEAHAFSRLNPLYAEHYDSDAKGYAATQKIIDGVDDRFSRGDIFGYITYDALGYANLCRHGKFDRSTSPIRHIFLKQSVLRFCDVSKFGGLRFKAERALEALTARFHLVFHDAEKMYYLYNGRTYDQVSDEYVQSLVEGFLGFDCEQDHVKKTIFKLQCQSLITADKFKPLRGSISFVDGLLDIGCLLDFSKPRSAIADLTLASFKFTPYATMAPDALKALYLTGTLGANFDPSATICEFASYLDSTFSGDVELISLAQEIAGYCLIYEYPLQAFFFFIGPGGNGKGVFMHVLAMLVGKTNVSHLNLAGFNRFSSANLVHKLANISDELPKKGSDWDRLKQMTGGGQMEGENKGKSTFFFEPTAKQIISTNEYPAFTDASPAFWERIKFLVFSNSFRQTQGEKHCYEALLKGELDGIAVWALHGLIRLLKRGKFLACARSHAVLLDARSSTDSTRSFIEERCTLDPRLGEYSDSFYRAYVAYCKGAGLRELARARLLARVEQTAVKRCRGPSNVLPRKWLLIGIGYDETAGKEDLESAKKSREEDVRWAALKPEQTCRQPIHLREHAANPAMAGSDACSSCLYQPCSARTSPAPTTEDQVGQTPRKRPVGPDFSQFQ